MSDNPNQPDPTSPQRVQIEIQNPRQPDPTHPANQPNAGRIKELTGERDTWRTQAGAHEATIAALQAQLRNQGMDATLNLAAVNHPNLGHPDVRRFFRTGYDSYAAEVGAEAPAFDAWLSSDAVASSPLYSAHFAAPATAPAAVAPVPAPAVAAPLTLAPAPPNPNAGVQPTPAPGQGWTDDAIARERARHGGRLQGSKALEVARSLGMNVEGLKGA